MFKRLKKVNKVETMVEVTTLVREDVTETLVVKQSELNSLVMAGVIILDMKEL